VEDAGTSDSGTTRRTTRFFDAVPTPEQIAAGERYLDSIRDRRPCARAVPTTGAAGQVPASVQARLLVDEGPMHLTEVKMSPGVQVPRHRHGLDQIVLVAQGSLWQGNRELGPGSGFFTPAGATYGLRAGPEGVTLHEFFFGEVHEWAPEVVDDPPGSIAAG
jgi:quercetin dioxygenase-like cupin family protein